MVGTGKVRKAGTYEPGIVSVLKSTGYAIAASLHVRTA